MSGIAFRELLDYTTVETRRWRAWLEQQPSGILDVPVGTGRTATLRGMLQHIFVVELRYADRLLGLPVSAYESVETTSIATLFDGFERARAGLERYLAGATADDLGRILEFETISAGTQRASARKIAIHALIHGIRHWAQVATALRIAGYPSDWQHDVLMSPALD